MSLAIVMGVAVVPQAQRPVGDADLAAASNGRTVRLGRIGGGIPVTEVPLEVYVARVIAGEGEPRAHDVAYQALAIAIRTYVMANPDRHPNEDFDFCDSTHCQVPRAATAVTRQAALATAGRILTYLDRPAELFYSASCGGRSESAAAIGFGADLPYLQVVDDDVHGEDQPWTTTLTLRQVQNALRRVGYTGQRLRDVAVIARNASGRVSMLRLPGLQPDQIAGHEFRAAVGALELRSTAFTIERRGESLRFTGRGFGHGVGMCVIGAGRRAARGESVEAILDHYYPGLKLVDLNAPEASTTAAPAVTPAAPVPTPSGAPAATAAAARRLVAVTVPPSSSVAAVDIENIAARAHDELSKALGVSVAPISIRLYDTLDAFRRANGTPWWISHVARGNEIALVPVELLMQREGLERTIRIGIAELLTADALANRPAWVRVGAARYFGRGRVAAAAATQSRLRCPEDEELTLPLSAVAQRDAEARAEACFAREVARVRDWRAVR